MQSEYAQTYRQLYEQHWWWRSREAIVLKVLRKLSLPSKSEAKILDVGCGDALFFPKLEPFGEVDGIEIDLDLLDPEGPYRDRISTLPLGDAAYAERAYDLIVALDVIEHIEDDATALDQLLKMLKPGGKLVITVPAMMWLWDEHDEINRHFRRYTTGSMRKLLLGNEKVKQQQILELRYLFHSLVPPKLAVAAVNRFRSKKLPQHQIPASWVNRTMAWANLTEFSVVGWMHIPWGTSVLAAVDTTR